MRFRALITLLTFSLRYAEFILAVQVVLLLLHSFLGSLNDAGLFFPCEVHAAFAYHDARQRQFLNSRR
jgi:hypothetical protein